ncbi:MAG TPA: hypothetical protein VG870_14340 [Chitinophagaceae bacterium]|nr:hypothetical protein [Chitinophagaceae bacterium]
MKTLRFKTNINCGSCVAKVTPVLNGNQAIRYWQVETGNPQKILTLQTDSLDASEIQALLATVGYRAELLAESTEKSPS